MSVLDPATSAVRAGGSVRRTQRLAVLGGLFVLGMFAAVIALRWHLGFSNVDDYLYALQTRAYLDAVGVDPRPLGHAWEAYGSNSPLVPMLALPIAAVSDSPHALVLIQIVPLLVVLVSVRILLRQLGSGPQASWIGAALITTLPPVLGYAAMYHFGVAATACVTAAAAAYACSDGLLRRRPALLLGVAVGLLSLTRVVAPVYVAALCLPIAVDALAGRDGREPRVRNGALAAAVAAVLAAPWWLLAGGTAVDYLTSAGYGHGTFTSEGSRLDIAVRRLTWTATETGWLLAVLVAALVVWAAVCVVRRAPGRRPAAWLIATSVLGLALLGTSSNAGTAFALPYVVLLCCVAVWGIEQLTARVRAVVVAGCLAALVVPALALFDLVGEASVDGRQLWQRGTPGLAQARAALGCDCAPPDTEALSDQVLRVVGDRPVLLVRDDAVLNANSLRFEAADDGSVARLAGPPADGKVTAAQLARVEYVVTGGTFGSFHANVNGLGLLLALRAARFQPVLSRKLSAANSVAVFAAPGAARRASR